MADSNESERRLLRPRPVSQPSGTGHPTGRPGGTGHPTGRPGGTGHPTGRPGEPAEQHGWVEDDRLTSNWIQYTERLKPGYSKDRYKAWSKAWNSRVERTGPRRKLVGPSNIGGRITCLAAPQGSRPLVAGAATGGLWLLDAAGPQWNSIDKKWKEEQDIQQAE